LSTKKIYIVRHGQTEFNKKGIVQGSAVNSSLNDTGREQADAFYQAYKHIPFDVVYTSALNRSIESVQAFIDQDVPHCIRPELNEISWGDMDGKLATAEEHNEYKELLQRWKEGDIDFKMWGGESPVDVQNRQRPVVEEILNSSHETLLICMHGRAIRILLSLLTDSCLSKMDQFEHTNLCLYVLEVQNGVISISHSNDQKHLG
jgi:broad specificity phosphatase PhoE